MRAAWAQTGGVLLLLSVLLGTSLTDGAFVEPSSLVLVAVGALLFAWGFTRPVGRASPTAGTGPAVASRGHRRALARRGVPRQRDPDAPGHTRSRAPSGLLPAV